MVCDVCFFLAGFELLAEAFSPWAELDLVPFPVTEFEALDSFFTFAIASLCYMICISSLLSLLAFSSFLTSSSF